MSREGYIAVVNGPNLNMLGRRQPGIYGTATLDDIVASLRAGFPQLDIRHECRQGEGALVELAIRRTSLLSPVCAGCICGFGAAGYALAVRALLQMK